LKLQSKGTLARAPGPTAERVVRLAPIPILSIPAPPVTEHSHVT